ncbi:FtsX-like permease family protein [Nonomuraea jiangxiensis]|uniref:Putative ABC transport system permease protein n=1 Tax=Nonomuraea jiangxiensis TaxID=633440 RepID=A0A1G8ZEU4_9ACTN|nr:FtsX-like permease family protein [Nonomuraea jiangxiensis]SDK13646.1 putative ABC transport system permease protein [Nonomuraea jiangxiensis]
MSAFLAALRLSRRDALRFRGRSALIMVMIGLPVLVVTAVLTGAATTDLTPQEKLDSMLGAADARLTVSRFRPTDQYYHGEFDVPPPTSRERGPWTEAEVHTLLDGRLLRYQTDVVDARLADGYDQVDVLEVDLRDPMTRGMRPLVRGRFAAAPGEVAVSPALLDRGVRLGGTITLAGRDRPARVVGVVEHPNRPGIKEVVGVPGSPLPDGGSSSGWLADTPGPVKRADIRRLNQAGMAVSSRSVIESPTPAELGEDRLRSPGREDDLVWLGLAIVIVVMEVVLLAGPAFAVGLRRRRRELAVIAAQGASGRQLRTIVLADGLVLGGAAALLGVALGIAAGLLVEPVVAARADWTQGPAEVPWWQVLGVAALGVVSGLVAALVPAVQAARQSPAELLAGRAAVDTRRRAGRPVLGLVLVALGLGTTFYSVRHGQLSVAVAAVLLVLGLVALMQWLVQATGRLSSRLPLPLRLTVRDASRHRVRTASAAAAVMAATMGTITLGIGLSSALAEREANRAALAPVGTLAIGGSDLDDAEWGRLRAEIGRWLPGVSLIPGLGVLDAQGRSVDMNIFREPEGCEGTHKCDTLVHSFMFMQPIGDERLLAFLQGRHDPRAAAALAAGKAVAFDPGLVRDGMIEIEAVRRFGDPVPPQRFKVAAVVSSGAEPAQTGVFLPPSAVTAAGFRVAERVVFAPHTPPYLERLERDLRAVQDSVYVRVEQRYDETRFTMLLALLGASMVVVLGGTFAATGLAAADMRQDLDTMSAVGGPPRVRRFVVAGQAAYIAGLGAVVGLAGGLVSGVALTWPMTRSGYRGPGEALYDPGPTTIDLPWPFLVAAVVGLPLLAALVAGAFTRTRLVPARRVA